MYLRRILPAVLLGGLAASAPAASGTRRDAGPSAVDVLKKIMPQSATCDTGAQFGDECTTAADAAPPLIDAFKKNGIYRPAEIAAVLSLIAVESGGLKFKHNHFPAPGRPGQGTSAMMMPNFVKEYADSIPDVAAKAASLTDPDQILALVTVKEHNFGAAQWFFKAKCADARSLFKTDPEAGFKAYMSCVGTSITDERTQAWEAAKAAFGI